jgi:galactokinase
MKDEVRRTFAARYGRGPALIARAPGRVNLVGEHTDYNDGLVLPAAVDRAVWIAAAPREDQRVRVCSLEQGGAVEELGAAGTPQSGLPRWCRCVSGAWSVLAGVGREAPGADLLIGSDVPIGAGLASSAALGVALIETLIALGGHRATALEKARWAQTLEHRFLGVPCGIMDQLAAASGEEGAALLIDCRSLAVRSVPVPAEVAIAVLDAKKPRRLAESAFARRRAECEEAARLVGVTTLRDATMDLVVACRARLGETLFCRARHVVTENARVGAAVTALAARALEELGRVLDASHASLRDDFAVSVPELDAITDIARAHRACYGARLMGAGFGGSAVAVVRAEAVEDFTAWVGEAYAAATACRPEVYVCRPSRGSGVERLGV